MPPLVLYIFIACSSFGISSVISDKNAFIYKFFFINFNLMNHLKLSEIHIIIIHTSISLVSMLLTIDRFKLHI